MPIKIYKPTSPARRKTSVLVHPELDKVRPLKSLVQFQKSRAGRNNQGKITVRHQGGGEKRYLRLIDFKGDKFDIAGIVKTIEYDPNRNVLISLVVYPDGAKRYLLNPVGLGKGQTVISSKQNFQFKVGNRFPLRMIPPGTMVHNVELEPGQGGKLARAGGTGVILMLVEGSHAQLKMPSGEVRLVPQECLASIGQLSNPEFRNIRWGKAGRMRHLGIRPTVRGKAMNPVDHPHGGGEGNSPIGLKGPKNVYGRKALGVKTRRAHHISDKLILSRRKK